MREQPDQLVTKDVKDNPCDRHVDGARHKPQVRPSLGQIGTTHTNVPADQGCNGSADSSSGHEAQRHECEGKTVGAQCSGSQFPQDDVHENCPRQNIIDELAA